MSDEPAARKEELILSCEAAVETATLFTKSGPDPRKNIPYSLLSSEHIEEYVKLTGLISPFYLYGGKKSRLKHAAYEGRIGKTAYYFDDNDNLNTLPVINGLTIPAESIIFVECDLEFRLPEFIALRFNLQIKHVHRGLLLGTGPLVDPGYWGKLCIPLHNLTDQPYTIPFDEGLIWLEFTKTTSDLQPKDKRKGRPPLDKEFWDISEFIDKARTLSNGEKVPIRSSIPSMVGESGKHSTAALKSAGQARELSAEAKSIADEAKTTAEKAKNRFSQIGIVGGLATIGTLAAVWVTFFIGMMSYYNALSTRIDSIVGPSSTSHNDQGIQLIGIEAKAQKMIALKKNTESSSDIIKQVLIENEKLKIILEQQSAQIQLLEKQQPEAVPPLNSLELPTVAK